jgi:dinuclear metal center YbgI/SA1388 family protein
MGGAGRDEIVAFCDGLLEIADFDDYGPNGLQVPGTAKVRKVVTGVSAHRELLERARDASADLVLVHHGLFWDFHPRALSEQMATRLRICLEAGISVAAYHLPLDAHPEVGNNALLARALGFEPDGTRIGAARRREIGVVARGKELAAVELFGAVRDLLGREPLVFDAGPERIASLAVVSGGGASYVHEAVALGLDAFLTGEPAEHAMADAREGGIHFIAAGHYATETLGIRRLGELVAERFGVAHEFVDVPNPI